MIEIADATELNARTQPPPRRAENPGPRRATNPDPGPDRAGPVVPLSWWLWRGGYVLGLLLAGHLAGRMVGLLP